MIIDFYGDLKKVAYVLGIGLVLPDSIIVRGDSDTNGLIW